MGGRKQTKCCFHDGSGLPEQKDFSSLRPDCNTGHFIEIQIRRKGALREKTMLKEKWKILKKCQHYRIPENPNTRGIGRCDLENQRECAGKIQFCKNPRVLNEYLLC